MNRGREKLQVMLVSLALVALPRTGAAQMEGPEVAASVKAGLLQDLTIVARKYVALAEAMPEATYTWRSMEGVRSVSEVYTHAAWVGLNFPARIGGSERPAENFAREDAAAITAKGDVLEWMRRGFQHAGDALQAMSAEELEAEVDFFGRKMPSRQAWSLVLGDLHEHLGQAIAYARVNEVVPPWTSVTGK